MTEYLLLTEKDCELLINSLFVLNKCLETDDPTKTYVATMLCRIRTKNRRLKKMKNYKR